MIYDGLNIVRRAADQQGQVLPREDVIDGGDGLLLEARNGIDFGRVGDIQQMVRHERLFFGGDFGRADVQAAIDLARIGGHYLAVKTLRKRDTEIALARCSWPKYDDQGGKMLAHSVHVLYQGEGSFC